jgi:hypothetical protein
VAAAGRVPASLTALRTSAGIVADKEKKNGSSFDKKPQPEKTRQYAASTELRAAETAASKEERTGLKTRHYTS